jgi:two-component system response regulator DevR
MISYDATPIRLLLVDDHEIVRTGIREVVSAHRNIEIVGECGTVSGAITESLQLKPHVVLMDIQLPDGSGLQACRKILASSPDIKVLFLTAFDDDEARLESIFAGSDAYLLKNIGAHSLINAIETVASGRPILDPDIILSLLKRIRSRSAQPVTDKVLSPQEQRIMSLVSEGMTNKEIGSALGLSDKTVKNYLSNVFQKLHVTRRSQAAALFTRRAFK